MGHAVTVVLPFADNVLHSVILRYTGTGLEQLKRIRPFVDAVDIGGRDQ